MTDQEFLQIIKDNPSAKTAAEEGRDGDLEQILLSLPDWPKQRKPIILGYRGLMSDSWLGIDGTAVLRATLNQGMSSNDPVEAAKYQSLNHALSSDEGIDVNSLISVFLVSSLSIDDEIKSRVLEKLVETPTIDHIQFNRVLASIRPTGLIGPIPE